MAEYADLFLAMVILDALHEAAQQEKREKEEKEEKAADVPPEGLSP